MKSPPRIVLTVSAGALTGMAAALPGLVVEEKPLLSFAPPEDWAWVDQALARLAEFSAVAFTSPRAARAVAERATACAWSADAAIPVWVTGITTASALNGVFGPPRLAAGGSLVGRPSPTEGVDGAGAALAREMIAAGTQSTVLYPCGEIHREELPAILTAAGIVVHPVTCYRPVLADEALARSALAGADLIVVGSSRVAELLARIARSGPRPVLLALGSTTAAAAREAGWPPAAVAARPTSESLAECVRQLIR